MKKLWKEEDPMQTIPQTRMFNRVMMLAIFVTLMIALSWRFAPAHNSAIPFTDANSILSDTSSRMNASTDEQIQTFQDQLKTDPNHWQAYSQLGLAYLQKVRETGDPTYYQKAEEALDKALSLQPDEYVSISARGTLALARHEFLSALEWGGRAKKINPDRTYAYGVIADAQIELGRYPEAVKTLQTMVDLRPDMSSYSRISYIRELHGDIPGALDMMQRAVDSGTPNTENTAWVRTQLGNLYFNTGDLDQAGWEYQRTLQDRPNYVYAIAGLGRVHAARGDMNEAIKLLNQAVSIIPMPEFVIMLGDLYQAAGQTDRANQQYKLLATMEKLYRANGVDMDMEIALFNADHNQNLEETIALAHKAYTNRPGIQGADALAWVLYKNGQDEEAQIYSTEALLLGTKDALKLFHAGMIAHALHHDQQAGHYLEQALEINPHFSVLYAEQAQKTLLSIPQAATK
jgi:tetratricopeptide (TPR) repeat protein